LGPPSITSTIEVDYATLPNEAVEKVLLTSEKDVFGRHFFYISPKNLLGAFSYGLNMAISSLLFF